jgi:periplasmic protein TonB
MLSQRSAVDDEPGLAPPAPAALVPALPEPEGFSRRLLAGAIVVSCTLHVAGAAAMLSASSALPDYGVITQQTDAISVEMTASTILEAVDTPASVAAAAAAPTAAQEGNPAASSTAAVPMTKVEETAVDSPVPQTVKATEVEPDVVDPKDEPLDVVRGAGEAADVIESKAAQRAEEEQRQPQKQEETEKQEVKVEQQQSATQVSGGATARSTAEADQQARVSASRCSILSYAAGIRAKVARNKPSGLGRHGDVEVSFGVTASGDLSYAELAQSSGNAKLDEAAVEAVRRSAPFGAPPADASPQQLRFSIPFYFR